MAATAVFVAVTACGGSEAATPIVPPPVSKLVCQVTASSRFVNVTTTRGATVDVSSVNCDRVNVTGVSLAAPVTLTASGTVNIAPASRSGILEAKGVAANGTGNTDTVLVFFQRPVSSSLVGSLPSSAAANSSHTLRVQRGNGTRCGAMWLLPEVQAYPGGTIFPAVRWSTVDTTVLTITLGSYVSARPERFTITCAGEDGSSNADTLTVQPTYPKLTSIDSIIPRTLVLDSLTTFRVFASGCPFTSPLGIRGQPGAVEGTLFFSFGLSLTDASAIPESSYSQATLESCNVVSFQFGWTGTVSPGRVFPIYVRNPGQSPVIGSVTLK